MKIKVLRSIIVIMAVVLLMLIMSGFAISKNFHSVVAIVTTVDEGTHLITVECGNGNIFSFYDTIESWEVGDLCSMIMYNKGTEIVADDIVVSSRYGGYVDLYQRIEESLYA